MKEKAKAALLAVLFVIASVSVTLSVDSDDNGHHKSGTITIKTANNKKVEAPRTAVVAAASGSEDGNTGPGIDTIATMKSSNKANPQAPSITGPVPAASPYQRGCLTRSNRHNFSYRNGTRPSLVVVHLPVAFNKVGWSDVNGVHIFLDLASTQASANYENDIEAHCILSVAESLKAWAQANANSATACSIEQQAYGNERVFVNGRGLHQLATIVHDCAHRWHIKLQRAKVHTQNGAVVVDREGVLDHKHLGAAGGGHVDVTNFGTNCINPAYKTPGAKARTMRCIDLIIKTAKKIH